MAMFRGAPKKPSEEIAVIMKAITEYNQRNPKEQIQFIHGGSSAPFSFVGRQVQIYRPKTGKTETTVIPNALIPTGFLRKKYGVYPISGELGPGVISYNTGERKMGINNTALSGMEPDQLGVETTFRYAKNAKFFDDISKLHKSMEETILKISHKDYIRNLKLLVMYSTSLMLMDPNNKEAANRYRALLDNELHNLEKRFQGDEQRLVTIRRYFNKYQPQINEILSGNHIPFVSDEKFRNEILDQFPIIYASILSGRGYREGVEGENIYEDEMPFDKIKIMFTPNQYVERLKNKLVTLGLTHIQVHGIEMTIEKKEQAEQHRAFSHIRKPPIPEEKKQIAEAFKNAKTLNELEMIVRQNTDLLKHWAYSDLLRDKIESLTKGYLKENDLESINMLVWLLKNMDKNLMQNTEAVLSRWYLQYLHLAPKVAADKEYLRVTSSISDQEFARLKIMPYLVALASVSEKLDDKLLLDFSTKISESQFNNLTDIAVKGARKETYQSDRAVRIGFLEKLYDIIMGEKDKNPQFGENMAARLEYLKKNYLETLMEYLKEDLQNARKVNPGVTAKDGLNERENTLESFLFASIKDIIESRIKELEKSIPAPREQYSSMLFRAQYDSGDEIYAPDTRSDIVQHNSTDSLNISNEVEGEKPSQSEFILPPVPPRQPVKEEGEKDNQLKSNFDLPKPPPFRK